ncbi:MFS transporter [Actinomadura kijaniata]|uniref:MFS transporter n=1 Tax=Actinomadura kijaniata TaxID=46161 RepID=UPI003F1DC2BD
MTTATRPPATSRAPLTSWLAVLAVTLGLFSIVTTEILPIGLLAPIAADFGVSAGTAGWTMTLPGLVAAVAAPAVTVASGRIDRRMTLCALTGLLAAADLLAAVAPGYWAVLVSRVMVGLVIGGFWSIGAGLAGRLVPAASVPRATSVLFAAVPLGSVLGVPAGSFLGDLLGWRASFAVMGALTVGVLAALAVLLPPLPPERATGPEALRGLLRRPAVRAGLVATLLIVLAHFATYTYVTPFLLEVTGVDAGAVGAFLLVYGVAGLVGNFAAGRMAPRAAFVTAVVLLAAATLLMPVAGRWDGGALALLVVWGVAYGAVPFCSQSWFAAAAPDAPEAATVVFTSSFQATLSLGALAGGVVVDALSVTVVMALGGAVAAAALATVHRYPSKC